MSGPADRYTDKTFSQLESRISKMYREAQKDLRQKLADFTRHHKIKDAEMLRKLKAGEITQAQYQQWITGQVFVGNQWKQKIEQINNSIKNVMQGASNLTHNKSMDVFAENANYTAYQLEKDIGASINFGLYDTSTVSRLVGKDPEILPRRVVNGKKLDAWETKKVSNAISQGIIQGEGIDQIANRIARDTCIAADKSSVMYARTAMTAAQNSGRIERLHEAEEMGIKVQKRWMATLDDRTRDSHRDMDGETVDVDEKFSNGLMYPGDPATNDFAEICNCRCTMVYVYPEFTQSFERSASLGYDEEGHHQYETVKDMTYREWAASKKSTSVSTPEYKETINQDEPSSLTIQDLYKIGEQQLANITDEQREAIEYYSNGNGYAMNEYLRGQKSFDTSYSKTIKDEIIKNTKLATQALRDAKLPVDVQTERGSGIQAMTELFKQIPDAEDEPALLVGSTFSDKAFLSTTVEKGYGEEFATSEGENGVLFHIDLQKGSTAMFIDPVQGEITESEVLCAPDMEFIITNAYYDENELLHVFIKSK